MLEQTSPITGHVYLAFNDESMGTQGPWQQALNDLGYAAGRDWYTFSFHPDSVRTRSDEHNRVTVMYTNSSWVDRNNQNADINPIVNGDAHLIHVTDDPCQQAEIFRAAHNSWNANQGAQNNDRGFYSFLVNNCGSWAKSIIEEADSEWPNEANFLNAGTGLGGPMDYTLLPQATFALSVMGYYTGEAIGVARRQAGDTLQDTYRSTRSAVTWIIRNAELSTGTFSSEEQNDTTTGAIQFDF